MKRILTAAAVLLAAFAAVADFPRVPKAALKALKVTRGKPFNSGVLFVDGKYVPPPYTVERYGTALRVNGQQVTGPLIAWDEFLKTQEGARIERSEQPAAAAPVVTAAPAPVDDDPLADLFDDEPATKPQSPVSAVRPAAPVVTTTVVFEGEFRRNAASDALLAKLNAMRTEIDAHLRRGGVICFGSAYSRVTGDAGAAKRILAKLPELMKASSSVAEFSDGIRDAGLVYFPEALNRDLYRNRIDYLKLIERRRKLHEEESLNKLLLDRNVY